MTITKDAETCGDGQRAIGVVTVGSGGALSGAVVHLTGIETGKAWSKPASGYLLEQEGCLFLPRTQVVRRSNDLLIKNIDPVFHNIHAYEVVGSSRISMFNEGQQPKTDMTKNIRLRRPTSNTIKLECDSHDFMHEWLFVADNPYYAVTDSTGAFKLDDVPDGAYTLRSWHPILGEKEQSVSVSGGALVQDFAY